jgi:hypothetical protein
VTLTSLLTEFFGSRHAPGYVGRHRQVPPQAPPRYVAVVRVDHTQGAVPAPRTGRPDPADEADEFVGTGLPAWPGRAARTGQRP